MSFVLRFWLERNEGAPSWRGRVIEMHDADTEVYVRDGVGLMQFVSRKLVEFGGVDFPFSVPPGGGGP